MKKLNNKGFSLVELIVVIAIMAILVGVLAPSVLGQLDKAKASKDKQAFDAVASAVAYAYADQDVTNGKPTGTSDIQVSTGVTFVSTGASSTVSGSANTSDFNSVILNMVGYNQILLESNEFRGSSVVVTLNPVTGKCTLTATNGSNVYTVTK